MVDPELKKNKELIEEIDIALGGLEAKVVPLEPLPTSEPETVKTSDIYDNIGYWTNGKLDLDNNWASYSFWKRRFH